MRAVGYMLCMMWVSQKICGRLNTEWRCWKEAEGERVIRRFACEDVRASFEVSSCCRV